MKHVLLVLVLLFVSLWSFAQRDYWNDRRRYGNQRPQVVRNMRNWEQQEREERQAASYLRNNQQRRSEQQRESVLEQNRSNVNNVSNKTTFSNTENNSSVQENDKIVTLVTNGTGNSKEEATRNALRSAIEQAYGTFVSANTEVLNDELVKDDIVTVSSGNIKSFKELSINQSNELYDVSVQATISIDQLTRFAKNRGMQAELAGASFVMNMKMRELNKKNELVAIKNLDKQLNTFNGLFDYVIKTGEPILDGPSRYKILVTLYFRENSETVQFYKTIYDTMESLSLSETEKNEYKKTNIPYYLYDEQLQQIKERDQKYGKRFALRNEYLPQMLSNGHLASFANEPWLMPTLMKKTLAFTIYDNLGNEIYCGENNHISGHGVVLRNKIYINSSKPIEVITFRDYGDDYNHLRFNPMAIDKYGYPVPTSRLATRYYFVLVFYIYYSEEELSQLEYLKVDPRQPPR